MITEPIIDADQHQATQLTECLKMSEVKNKESILEA